MLVKSFSDSFSFKVRKPKFYNGSTEKSKLQRIQIPEFHRFRKQCACVVCLGHYFVLLKLQLNNRLSVSSNELNFNTQKEHFIFLFVPTDTHGVCGSVARCVAGLLGPPLDLEAENSARSDSPVKASRLGVYLAG